MDSPLTIDNINTASKLGVALKRLRKHMGMSQAEMANFMNMRQPTISDVESGRGSLDSLFKIIQALKINLVLSSDQLGQSQKSNSKTKDLVDFIFESKKD